MLGRWIKSIKSFLTRFPEFFDSFSSVFTIYGENQNMPLLRVINIDSEHLTVISKFLNTVSKISYKYVCRITKV